VIELTGTLQLADRANCTMLHLSGGNVLIEGNGTLDGNGANQTRIVAGIDCGQVQRVVMRGFRVTNVHGWPLNFINESSDIWVSELELSNSLNAPEFANRCFNCWADKMRIVGIGDYGWCFYGGVVRSGLTNSVIENCAPGAGVLSDVAQPWACEDILIANNIFYVPTGVTAGNVEAIYVVNNTGDPANDHSHVMVDNNVIHGSSTRSGGQHDAVGTFAALIAGANDSRFSNNLLHDSESSYGLEISGGRVLVAGNNFHNVGSGRPVRTSVGISLNGAHGCVVYGNSVVDTQPTKTLAYGIAGTSGGNNAIYNNHFSGAGASLPQGFARGAGDIVVGNLAL
jgi:hypothetical protein